MSKKKKTGAKKKTAAAGRKKRVPRYVNMEKALKDIDDPFDRDVFAYIAGWVQPDGGLPVFLKTRLHERETCVIVSSGRRGAMFSSFSSPCSVSPTIEQGLVPGSCSLFFCDTSS